MSEEKLSVFPMGEKNDAYARYFVGQSYLKMLTTEEWLLAMLLLSPGCRNNWLSIIKAGRYCLSQADEVIIRVGETGPGAERW